MTKQTILSDDACWAALAARDKTADTLFVYAVKTTQTWGFPSTVVRLPKRENTEFFATPEEAEAHGYRAGKRRQRSGDAMTQRHAEQVVLACRELETRIDNGEPLPSLAELATLCGVSQFHFHRIFRSHTGLTPAAWAKAYRGDKLREQLTKQTTITGAIAESGFSSGSRFYESSDTLLGMTPKSWRAGGKGARIFFALAICALGDILVAQSEKGICAILLGDDAEALLRDLQDQFPNAELVGGDAQFEQVVSRVIGFVEAPSSGLDLPLDIRGTAFQRRVWQALQSIPAGTTVSYREIAERIGSPKAVRAVAGACAANCLAVAIPCHRVVRTGGELAGYRWGIERKKRLLQREALQQETG
ncbi:bifunctional DNA-binding transcriptional regulator/O6-methylguanine-DNA methyltransferase Ada [Morganella morganii]|nr:bifunctional DNA-binding transcriptional regulator/O6-methylguanine-DNA methyltransferase Ada [Morganella morganii]